MVCLMVSARLYDADSFSSLRDPNFRAHLLTHTDILSPYLISCLTPDPWLTPSKISLLCADSHLVPASTLTPDPLKASGYIGVLVPTMTMSRAPVQYFSTLLSSVPFMSDVLLIKTTLHFGSSFGSSLSG
jgi:hypothetical protein